MVQPDWKEGDVAWEADLQLADGYVCHVRVLHPSPRGILAQLKAIGRLTNCVWSYDGQTTEQWERTLEESQQKE